MSKRITTLGEDRIRSIIKESIDNILKFIELHPQEIIYYDREDYDLSFEEKKKKYSQCIEKNMLRYFENAKEEEIDTSTRFQKVYTDASNERHFCIISGQRHAELGNGAKMNGYINWKNNSGGNNYWTLGYRVIHVKYYKDGVKFEKKKYKLGDTFKTKKEMLDYLNNFIAKNNLVS